MDTFVHSVLCDMPAGATDLPENVPNDATLSAGSGQGTSDFGRTGYGGLCPPGGARQYSSKIYALDKKLGLAPGARKADLIKAVEGRILAQGQLVSQIP